MFIIRRALHVRCATGLKYRSVGATATLTSERHPNLQRGDYAQLTQPHIQQLQTILGKENVLVDDIDAYNKDWLGIYSGASGCVVRPGSAEECSRILQLCDREQLAVCVQGGNTGLVGGAVPVFDELILNMQRMNKIQHFDTRTGILQVEAGAVLEQVDNILSEQGYMMPIDLGAKGSCHIGGNVATAAGGIRLIRYGSLHAHVLGLTVVLADGTIVECGSALRKDNTGLHLPHLFVGSEGCLGIITNITMTVVPRPQSVHLAFLAVPSFDQCLDVLELARSCLGEVLSSFEFVDAATMQCVTDNLHLHNPLAHTQAPFYLLVETSGSDNNHDLEKMSHFVEQTLSLGHASDGVLAQSEQQRLDIWKLRESGAEALKKDGHTYKQDFSLSYEQYQSLAEACRERLGDLPTRVVLYGHLADGNAHLNITSPQYDPRIQKKLYPWLYEWVAEREGSISAEHGIGFAKRPFAHYSQNKQALQLMTSLKQLFDPKHILNPYKGALLT